MSRIRLVAVILALSTGGALAAPGRYVVECNATCTAPDGTQQPAGTVLNRVLVDPDTMTPPPNTTFVADTGQAVYWPAPPTPTRISALAFIQRFTPAEQAALQAANPMWGLQIAAAGTINVKDPLLLADMAQAVAAGKLTQARMTQILDLSQSSP